MVRKRPRNESAIEPQISGKKAAVPSHRLTFEAAAAVDSPNCAVKQVIRFEATPKQANFSDTSAPVGIFSYFLEFGGNIEDVGEKKVSTYQ